MPPLDQPGVHEVRTQLVLGLRYVPHLFSVRPSTLLTCAKFIIMLLCNYIAMSTVEAKVCRPNRPS